MVRVILIAALLISQAFAQQCISEWGQCGGQYYNGVKTCCSGTSCVFKNEWYSQCIKSQTSPSPSPPTSPSPSPRVSPSPSPSPSPAANRSAGCGKTKTLNSGNLKITSSGTSRSYNLNIPSNYNSNTAYKLVFGFHWLNGNYQNVVSGNFYGLLPLSQKSTIFIAPDGINAGWGNDNGRDVTLVDDLLKLVQNDLCIDTSRIFATGFSYGGAMSFSLACSRPNVFRAVAVIAGAQLSGCAGGQTPIAYLGIHGVVDSVLNISNGRTLRDKYVALNKCQSMNPQEPSSGQGTHICTKYNGCSAGYPVTWCAHSGDHVGDPKDNGSGSSWAPGVTWDFFKQF